MKKIFVGLCGLVLMVGLIYPACARKSARAVDKCRRSCENLYRGCMEGCDQTRYVPQQNIPREDIQFYRLMDHCSDRCQDNEQRCYRDCEKLDNYYRHP